MQRLSVDLMVQRLTDYSLSLLEAVRRLYFRTARWSNSQIASYISRFSPRGYEDAKIRSDPSDKADLRASDNPNLQRALGILAPLPAIVAFALYLNTLQNGLVYDDLTRITSLPATLPGLDSLFSRRGITLGTLLFDRWMWADSIAGYHLTNVALHALASTLAAYVVWSLSRCRRVALVAGVLFAAHPVHVEAVASIANRKDILAMIFGSLALILWRRTPSVLTYLGATASLALAFISKEVAALGFVPMLFLSDLLSPDQLDVQDRRWRPALRRIAPVVLAALLLTVVEFGDLANRFRGESIHQITETQLQSYSQVAANAAATVPEIARLLVWPRTLSADYPPDPALTLGSPKALFGIFLAAVWLAAGWWLTRRGTLEGFALLWPLVSYFACFNLIPFNHFFLAERYLYVPSFGFCLLLAIGFETAWEGSRGSASRVIIVAVAAFLLVLAGARSIARNADWSDPQKLWTATLEAGYPSWRAHNNLGYLAAKSGRYDTAIEHFEESLEILPAIAHVQDNLTYTLLQADRLDAAGRHCQGVLQTRPGATGCLLPAGRGAEAEGDLASAASFYERALAIDPDDVAVLVALGELRATAPGREQDRVAAGEHFRRALEITRYRDPEVMWAAAVTLEALSDSAQARKWAQRAHLQASKQGMNSLVSEIATYLEGRQTTPPHEGLESEPAPAPQSGETSEL